MKIIKIDSTKTNHLQLHITNKTHTQIINIEIDWETGETINQSEIKIWDPDNPPGSY